MLTRRNKFPTLLNVYFFNIAYACRIGEALISPVNRGVNGGEHVFLYGGTELNVSYNFGSLLFVHEFGVGDVFGLRPLHGGFTLIVQPIEYLGPDLLIFRHCQEWK